MSVFIGVSFIGIIISLIAFKACTDKNNENRVGVFVIAIIVMAVSLINLSDFIGYYIGYKKVEKVTIHNVIKNSYVLAPLIETSQGKLAIKAGLKDKIENEKKYNVHMTPFFGRVLNLEKIENTSSK